MPVFLSSKAENGNKVFNDVSEEINIPILHIADAAAAAVRRDNIKKVGLLGTRFTMTQDFIKDRLGNMGLEVIVPDEDDSSTDSIIHKEMERLEEFIIISNNRDECNEKLNEWGVLN